MLQLKYLEKMYSNPLPAATVPPETKILLAQRLHTQDRMEIMTA